jgi:transposase
MMLSEGQMSDHKGARLMLDALPKAKALIADRGYDSNWFRNALHSRGAPPASPQPETARSRSITTRRCTGPAIKSKTCSQS